jgi:xanthine dehydrogenase accessory factor
MTSPDPDEVAHGRVSAQAERKLLVAVFASPVASFLLRYAADAGYRTVLVEPEAGLAETARTGGAAVVGSMTTVADGDADVVVTDHHRAELGVQLRDALVCGARWVGIMGNPRVEPPHVAALAELGVPPDEIAKVHRPIGLNIGSRAPAEIAIATLAGLIADRNGKPGGFAF